MAGSELEGGGGQAALLALDEDDRAFVRGHVDGALARRGPAFLRARHALWIQWLLGGCIGIGGMLLLDWSGRQAVLLMLATFWFGWIEDLVVWCLRRTGLALGLRHATDDLRFWQLVALMRGQRKQAPDRAGHPAPGLGLAVDLVAGIAASVLVIGGLERGGSGVQGALETPGLAIAIVVPFATGFVPALCARLARSADGSTPLPLFAVGQRGIGMLVLAFALMTLGGGRLAPTLLVGCACAFGMLVSAIELAWGVPALREEVRWAEGLRATGMR